MYNESQQQQQQNNFKRFNKLESFAKISPEIFKTLFGLLPAKSQISVPIKLPARLHAKGREKTTEISVPALWTNTMQTEYSTQP